MPPQAVSVAGIPGGVSRLWMPKAGVRQCRWQQQLLTSGRVCTGKSSMRLKGDCRGQRCQVSPAKSLSFRQGRGDGEEGGRLGRSPVHSGSDSRSPGMRTRGSGLHKWLRGGMRGRGGSPCSPGFCVRRRRRRV